MMRGLMRLLVLAILVFALLPFKPAQCGERIPDEFLRGMKGHGELDDVASYFKFCFDQDFKWTNDTNICTVKSLEEFLRFHEMSCFEFVCYCGWFAGNQELAPGDIPKISLTKCNVMDTFTAQVWDRKTVIPAGKVIAGWARWPVGDWTHTSGNYYHVGISLGDGRMISLRGGTNITVEKISDCFPDWAYSEVKYGDFNWKMQTGSLPEDMMTPEQKAEYEKKKKEAEEQATEGIPEEAPAEEAKETSCGPKIIGESNIDLSVADQAGLVDVNFQGHNRASGDILDLGILNNIPEDLIIVIPTPGIYQPLSPEFQRMLVTEGGPISVGANKTVERPLKGFCLDPQNYPPPNSAHPSEWTSSSPGDIFRERRSIGETPGFPEDPIKKFIDEELDKRIDEILNAPRVPKTVERLQQEKKISTGLPPEKEVLTLSQWFIWNFMENFGPEQGKEKITEQVKESGGKQTPEQIEQLNENIWEGIDLVKKRLKTQERGQG